MSAVLFISIFLLVVTSFAIFRSKRSSSNQNAYGHLPPPPRSLFEGSAAEPLEIEGATRQTGEPHRQHQMELCERARGGDFEALVDAHTTLDRELYREVLHAAFNQHSNDAKQLSALASFIAGRNQLRADPVFARALLEAWRRAPEQISPTEMLRIAALSDDPAAYESAVEAVLEFWKEGCLPEFSAEGLRRLFESEYWVLGADARRSGASFVLKETLADARRQLASTGARPISEPPPPARRA